MTLVIGVDGKVEGVSTGTGCRNLGLATRSSFQTMVNLDLTLSMCQYAAMNRRLHGSMPVYADRKEGFLQL